MTQLQKISNHLDLIKVTLTAYYHSSFFVPVQVCKDDPPAKQVKDKQFAEMAFDDDIHQVHTCVSRRYQKTLLLQASGIYSDTTFEGMSGTDNCGKLRGTLF